MSDFKAKMHQIQFRLGLRPRLRCGSYNDPQTLAIFIGPTSKGGEWVRNNRAGGERGKEGRK